MKPLKRKKLSHAANCFPDPHQELLLRACIFSAGPGLQAWEQWKDSVDLDDIDWASFRLLPMLYRKLSLQGVQDPLMGKLKGIYRYNWAKNQRLIHRTATLLKLFQDHSIETILLKGGAMSLFYYEDSGLRFMDDFDFMVKFCDAPRALDLIQNTGWVPEIPTPRLFNPHSHAKNFRESKNVGIDIHWHLLSRCFSEKDDESFWGKAIPTKIQGVPTHILDPADQLLQTCIHGAAWNGVPPIRWIADAMILLQRSGEHMDWDRLLSHAEKWRLSVPLGETLRYLSEEFSAPISSSVLDRLMKTPVEKWEIREYLSEIRARKWLGEFPYHWHRYHRSAESRVYKFKLRGFFKYLQGYLGLANNWQVTGFLLSNFFTKTKKNISKSISFNLKNVPESWLRPNGPPRTL